MCDWKQGISFDLHYAELLTLAKSFGDLKDQLIKDKIVTEIRDNAQREWLLCDRDLNLDKAVQMCKATETTQGTGQGAAERRHGYAHFKSGGPAGK